MQEDISSDQHSSTNTQIYLQFQTLLSNHSQHSLILVGPQISFFPGKIAFDFHPLPNNTLKQQPQLQPSPSKQLTNPKIQPESFPTKSFERTINTKLNLPPNRVIQIDDSNHSQKNIKQQTTTDIQKPIIKLSLPTFLNDKKQYTPTFVIQSTALTDQQYHNQFNNKIREYRRQVSRDMMMQPRPRTKYLYCAICKNNYEQYLGHVITKTHIQNYQKCKYTRYLTSLELTLNTGTFKKQRQREIQKKQELSNKKQRKNTSFSKDKSKDKTKIHLKSQSNQTSQSEQSQILTKKQKKNRNKKSLKKQNLSQSSETSRDRSKKSLRRSREQKNAKKAEEKRKRKSHKKQKKMDQNNQIKVNHQ